MFYNIVKFHKLRNIIQGFHYAQKVIRTARDKLQMAIFKADLCKAFVSIE
jgi:hypothetical protein